jgi:diguanylate cyclase (GGDEF)-like protein
VRPLKQLTDTAEKIAGGVNDAKIEDITINSKDEIGTLSRVLINSYKKIQEYTTYIDALAHRDSLTGVKNSTSYAEAIAEVNKEINLDNPRFGVLVADINNLKVTNDKYGHDVGNELIIHTAKILTETFKTSSVFRIGGDEFAVLLKGSDYENYRALLVSFDDNCSNDYISVYENKLPISIARGVSIYDPEIDVVYEDVFAKADHAMYLNKQETKLAMK